MAKMYWQNRGAMLALNGTYQFNQFNDMQSPWFNWSGQFLQSGSPPGGTSTMAGYYSSYCVLAMKVSVTFTNLDPAHQVTINTWPSINNNPTNVDADDVAPYIGRAGSKYVVLGPRDGGSNTKTLTRYLSVNKTFGVKKDVVTTDENYFGQITTAGGVTTPALPCYLMWSFQREDSAGTALNVAMLAKSVQYVKFFDRRPNVPV